MTTKTKSIIAIVLAVVICGAIYGAYQYPKAAPLAVGSPAGTSFSNAKVAEQIVTVATTGVYAILNGDASDRTIQAVDMAIANALSTTTSSLLKCATSTSASALVSSNGTANTNYIVNTSLDANIYGTTTGAGLFMASSSPGLTGTTTSSVVSPQFRNPYLRNWASGSYLTCLLTTGDNTNGFSANTTGFIGFPYRGQ